MTIKQEFPDNLALLLNLKVHKVHYEPNSESTWWVEYENIPMMLEEMFGTTEEDEISPPKEIKAQIRVEIYETFLAEKKEKFIVCPGSQITATGIVEDIIEEEGDQFVQYVLNSTFPLVIGEIPEGAKIGDWITVVGGARMTLPRYSDTSYWLGFPGVAKLNTFPIEEAAQHKGRLETWLRHNQTGKPGTRAMVEKLLKDIETLEKRNIN